MKRLALTSILCATAMLADGSATHADLGGLIKQAKEMKKQRRQPDQQTSVPESEPPRSDPEVATQTQDPKSPREPAGADTGRSLAYADRPSLSDVPIALFVYRYAPEKFTEDLWIQLTQGQVRHDQKVWSRRAKGQPIEAETIFSVAEVEGRDPSFAARELWPKYRKYIDAEAAKIPNKFKVVYQPDARAFAYDFDAKALYNGRNTWACGMYYGERCLKTKNGDLGTHLFLTYKSLYNKRSPLGELENKGFPLNTFTSRPPNTKRSTPVSFNLPRSFNAAAAAVGASKILWVFDRDLSKLSWLPMPAGQAEKLIAPSTSAPATAPNDTTPACWRFMSRRRSRGSG